MGETRRLGDREPASTQATSSSVRAVRRARSAARWPAASRTRSRRERAADGSSSPASRSARRRESTSRPTRPDARARTSASPASAPGGDGGAGARTGVRRAADVVQAELEAERLGRRARRLHRLVLAPVPGRPGPPRPVAGAGSAGRPAGGGPAGGGRPASETASAASAAPADPGSSKGRAAAASARNRPGPISTPRLSVITSSTSWASSKTTSSWGGRTAPPLARWAP